MKPFLETLTRPAFALTTVASYRRAATAPDLRLRPRLQLIRRTAAAFCGVSAAELRDPRTAHAKWVRQACMSLQRELTRGSTPEIGRFWGLDHTSVLHACRIIADAAQTHPQVARDLATLRTRCQTRLEQME